MELATQLHNAVAQDNGCLYNPIAYAHSMAPTFTLLYIIVFINFFNLLMHIFLENLKMLYEVSF